MRSEQSEEKSRKSMISADFDCATSWLRSRNLINHAEGVYGIKARALHGIITK